MKGPPPPARGDGIAGPDLGTALVEALEHASFGIAIVRVSGDRLERRFVNAHGAAMFGFDPDAPPAPFVTVAPQDRERTAAAIREAARSGEPRHLVHEVTRADGSTASVALQMIPIERPEPLVVVVFSDASEQTRTSRALEHSEARFRHLAEAAPDIITVVMDGRFVWANPAAANVLGLDSVEEFLAMGPQDFMPPDEVRAMGQRLARVARGERLPPRAYRAFRKDGTPLVMEISSRSIEYDGRAAVLAYGRDVTERERMHARAARHDRLAAVGTLAAGVAHEINNPLTYILLHLEDLNRHLKDLLPEGPGRERALAQVRESVDGAERVAHIVRGLLEVARPRGPERVLTDLRQVCDAALRLARATVEPLADLSATYEDVPAIASDPAKLTQVLLNLLVNAAQAAGQETARGHVSLALRQASQRVRLEVSDDGPGIADQHFAQLFTPFFTTKGVGGGTGLGLAVSHAIVSSLGGTITAENLPGRGARFTVELPVEAAATAKAGAAPARRHVDGTRRRCVAIIDDEASVAMALATVLGEHHDCITFHRPQEAVEQIAVDPRIEAVVCDVLMPELSGERVFTELLVRRPEIAGRFALMTGGALPARVAELVKSRGLPVLHKPFRTREVLEVLEALTREQ